LRLLRLSDSGLRSFGFGEAILQREENGKRGPIYKMATEFFENMVLKWSLQDIMDENLYKDKVSISYV
jgi:hypothetical protein